MRHYGIAIAAALALAAPASAQQAVAPSKWGAADEIGAANYITPARVVEAAKLVKTGKISYETGLEKCHHVEDFNRLTGRFSGGSQGAAGLGDQASMGGSSFGNQAF